MKRIGFKMELLPNKFDEYKNRHDNIWPEISDLLTEVGVRNYSIFYDKETNALFATHELDENLPENGMKNNRLMQKWWDYMADIMVVNEDNSPVIVLLEQAFRLD